MTEQILAVAGVLVSGSAAAAVVWKILRFCGCILEGMRCQLRTELLRTYYRHKDQKQIRQYEMENFVHNFNAYIALGGNSFIQEIRQEVMRWEVVS